MMRFTLNIVAILVLSVLWWVYPVFSQIPVGTWRDHFSYSHAVRLVETDKKLFCVTRGGMFALNPDDHSLSHVTRIQGLSDNGIADVAWEDATKTLIVAYENTNIDLVKEDQVINLSDILRQQISGVKKIYRIRIINGDAWLATSFGIVVVNLEKKEIKDTYRIGENGVPVEIHDLTRYGDDIYVTTPGGIYRAPADSPDLVYFGTWERLTGTPSFDKSFNHIAVFNQMLFVNRSDETLLQDSVYMFDGNSWSLFSSESGIKNRSFRVSLNRFLVSSYLSLKQYDLNFQPVQNITDLKIVPARINDALIDRFGILRIANNEGGLISTSDYIHFESDYPNGPYTNDAFSVVSWKGHVAVAGGGRDVAWNNIFRNGMMYHYSGGEWHSLINLEVRDIVNVLPDPYDPEKIYAASWGYGILVYENNKLVQTWDDNNSSLQSIIPGSPFVRIGGMAFDGLHRLWVTNTGVNEPVSVKDENDQWISIPYGPYINAPTIGQLLITQSGIKWIQLPRGYGLFVFDDNGTPENISDDRYRKLSVTDQDGQTHNDVYCMAEDKSGYVWIGTSDGPLVYYNADRILDDPGTTAQRILVPRNDGTGLADYLLGTEKINAIFIDGADRKWFGTEKAGAFLISPDGTKKILSLNTKNSPLPSDLIYGITVEPGTGEVFFATAEGVVSYRGSATEPASSPEGVYAFPNPVRPGFSGMVTITGLPENSSIKITDISGNLVFETRSLGGQAFWNMKNQDGRAVNSGVYLVFITNDDGSQTRVTKILLVR